VDHRDRLEHWRRHHHHRPDERPVVVEAQLRDAGGRVVAEAWAVFLVTDRLTASPG